MVNSVFEPLNLIIPRDSVKRMLKCIRSINVGDSDVAAVANASVKHQFSTITHRRSLQLLKALDTRFIMLLNLHFAGPKIRVPARSGKQYKIIFVDLGDVKISSQPSEIVKEEKRDEMLRLGTLILSGEEMTALEAQKLRKTVNKAEAAKLRSDLIKQSSEQLGNVVTKSLKEEDNKDGSVNVEGGQGGLVMEKSVKEIVLENNLRTLDRLISGGKEISERTIFDTFQISVENVAIYAQELEWKSAPKQTAVSKVARAITLPDQVRSEHAILDPFNVSIALYKSVAPDDVNFPKIKINGEVDTIKTRVC
jgi:hypothetical protein